MARTFRTLAFPFALVLLSSAVAHAQITFHQDFDSGSLDIAATTVEEPDSSEPTVTLAPRDLVAAGRWIQFDIVGVKGKRPTFRVPRDGDAAAAHRDDHRYVYSLDAGVSYHYFDDAEQGDDYYSFAPDEPFEQNTVRIAYSLPYPVYRSVAHTYRIAQSRWVRPTDSANVNFVIGYSPGTEHGGYTDEGRELPSLPLLGYRITDPDVDDDEKQHVILLSGTHASESSAHWVLEGLVNFLISDDALAASLRENLIFHVYPQVNPEGRWAGYQRTSPQHPEINFNRDWRSQENDTLAMIADAMRSDTDADVAMLIDFHSHRTGFVEVWDFEGVEEQPFYKALKRRRPEFRTHDFDTTRSTSGWARDADAVNAEYAFTAETGFVAGWQAEDYHELSHDYAHMLHEVLVESLDPAAPAEATD